MKKFEEYQDGEQVYYNGNLYIATKSKITHNAFKLKSISGLKDELVDISEIGTISTTKQHIESCIKSSEEEYQRYLQKLDSDFDSSGIYQVQD